MLLYLIRHGDPIYDPDSLTPLGERQAEAIGRRLATHGLDHIYVSSSNRAILTAKPAGELTHLTPEILDWCNEGHVWDEFTTILPDGSKTWVFFEKEFRKLLISSEMKAMGNEWHTHPAFAETRCTAGVERIRRCVTEFCSNLGYDWDEETRTYKCTAPNDKRIALFAHHGFSMAFLSTLLDIPYPAYSMHFDMSHSCMTVIDFRDEGGYCIPTALQVSGDSHLYAENLPTKYQNVLFI